MPMPLSTLITNVRDRFEATSTTRWDRDAIVAAINEGLEELAEDTGFYEQWVSVPLQSGRVHYDLRGVLPGSALAVTSVYNTITETWMSPINRQHLPYAEVYRNQATPLYFWVSGCWWLGIYPHPSADSGWLRVYYKAIPEELSKDQDLVPDLSDNMLRAVENYALYSLYGQEAEVSKALIAYTAYQESIQQTKDLVKNRVRTSRRSSLSGGLRC